ncbi:MAG: UMP kinase [Clostridia bacterium]|nr:UMP kinase [Clostridia bacterium]
MKYNRILLKLSGEAMGLDGKGFNFDTITQVAKQISALAKNGTQVGIVIGAGNIWRGRQGTDMDRVAADHMGMLATIINSLAMKDAIEKFDIKCNVMTSIAMDAVAEPYASRRAKEHLENGEICIFAGGTGSPFFSTDTAASLRAAEIEADAILLAKNIDGVYSADPRKDASAKRYRSISFAKVLSDRLQVMDSSATAMCMDNDIPVCVFALNEKDSISRVSAGEALGTVVKNDIKDEFYAD